MDDVGNVESYSDGALETPAGGNVGEMLVAVGGTLEVGPNEPDPGAVPVAIDREGAKTGLPLSLKRISPPM